jgi:hypothetical protein
MAFFRRSFQECSIRAPPGRTVPECERHWGDVLKPWVEQTSRAFEQEEGKLLSLRWESPVANRDEAIYFKVLSRIPLEKAVEMFYNAREEHLEQTMALHEWSLLPWGTELHLSVGRD